MTKRCPRPPRFLAAILVAVVPAANAATLTAFVESETGVNIFDDFDIRVVNSASSDSAVARVQGGQGPAFTFNSAVASVTSLGGSGSVDVAATRATLLSRTRSESESVDTLTVNAPGRTGESGTMRVLYNVPEPQVRLAASSNAEFLPFLYDATPRVEAGVFWQLTVNGTTIMAGGARDVLNSKTQTDGVFGDQGGLTYEALIPIVFGTPVDLKTRFLGIAGVSTEVEVVRDSCTPIAVFGPGECIPTTVEGLASVKLEEDLRVTLLGIFSVTDALGATLPDATISSETGITLIPVPAAAWLFGPALAVLGALRRRTR